MEDEVQREYLPQLKATPDIFQRFRGLTFENIQNIMEAVAMEQEGYTIDENHSQSITASSLEACHQMGLLQSQYAEDMITYTFPSRLHQR